MARSLGPEDIQLAWSIPDNEQTVKDQDLFVFDNPEAVEVTPGDEPWTKLGAANRSVVLGDGVVDARGGGSTIAVLLRVNTKAGMSVESAVRNITMRSEVPHFVPAATLRG